MKIFLFLAVMILLVLLPIIVGAIAYLFGKADIFFTIVNEAEARAKMLSGSFLGFMMAFRGHIFAKDIRKDSKGEICLGDVDLTEYHKLNPVKVAPEDPIRRWEVLRLNEQALKNKEVTDHYKLPLWGGLRWVGLWPWWRVHSYDFKWASLEQSETAAVSVIKPFLQNIQWVFLKDDVYAGKIDGAETIENMPVDIVFLLTLRVANPYLALFRVHHWLEAILNQIGARIREIVGSISFAGMISQKKAAEEALENSLAQTILDPELRARVSEFLDKGEKIGANNKEEEKKKKLQENLKKIIEESALAPEKVRLLQLAIDGKKIESKEDKSALYLILTSDSFMSHSFWTYGIFISRVQIHSVTPGEARSALAKASVQKYLGERYADEVTAKAKGDAAAVRERIVAVLGLDSEKVRDGTQQYTPEQGLQVRTLEALEKVDNVTVVGEGGAEKFMGTLIGAAQSSGVGKKDSEKKGE